MDIYIYIFLQKQFGIPCSKIYVLVLDNCTGQELQFYTGECHKKSIWIKLNLDIMEIILEKLDINSLLNFYQADKTHRDFVAKTMRKKYLFVCHFCDKKTFGAPYVDSCHILTIK